LTENAPENARKIHQIVSQLSNGSENWENSPSSSSELWTQSLRHRKSVRDERKERTENERKIVRIFMKISYQSLSRFTQRFSFAQPSQELREKGKGKVKLNRHLLLSAASSYLIQ